MKNDLSELIVAKTRLISNAPVSTEQIIGRYKDLSNEPDQTDEAQLDQASSHDRKSDSKSKEESVDDICAGKKSLDDDETLRESQAVSNQEPKPT